MRSNITRRNLVGTKYLDFKHAKYAPQGAFSSPQSLQLCGGEGRGKLGL